MYSRERSVENDKQDMIDFQPIEVKEIGLQKLQKRKKEPEGSIFMPKRSSLKDSKGIAELFAT